MAKEAKGVLSRVLSADDFLSANDLEVIEVEVPESKGSVLLRALPADEGLALNEQMQALPKERQHESLFLLLEACLSDKEGRRIITTDEHRKKLRGRSMKVLARLQKEALKLQGWNPETPGVSPAKNA